jgi:hypothetical protein
MKILSENPSSSNEHKDSPELCDKTYMSIVKYRAFRKTKACLFQNAIFFDPIERYGLSTRNFRATLLHLQRWLLIGPRKGHS